MTDASEAINRFEDIRPYEDAEIAGVVARLVDNREFIDTLARIKYSRLAHWIPWLLRPVIHRVLRREFGHLNSVQECQDLISGKLNKLLKRVADGVTISGLDQLERGRAYLFIGNHRDIAMDPAMINVALHGQDMSTTRIAIGDNLLSKAFISDLMRLNKSFIVKRSSTARREKLAALKELSAYINHSLASDGQSIWIAQREGRAKDGIDGTETALLKMLVLNRSKQDTFGDAFDRFHVVPVTVSYEWDPCDAIKAHELYTLQQGRNYEKAEHEDIASIYNGIVGDKGHIEVVFGKELEGPFASADAAAAAIDQQIIANYRLQASNLLAYEQLYGECSSVSEWKLALGNLNWSNKLKVLQSRLAQIPISHRNIMLAAYANPVRRRMELID